MPRGITKHQTIHSTENASINELLPPSDLLDGQDFAPGCCGPDVHHKNLLPLELLNLSLFAPLLSLNTQQPPQEVETDLNLHRETRRSSTSVHCLKSNNKLGLLMIRSDQIRSDKIK